MDAGNPGNQCMFGTCLNIEPLLTVMRLLYESVELLMLNFSIEMISVSYRNVEKIFMIR